MTFESLRRHPDSGIFQLRKRVPKWLRRTIGKREIKISLQTRDPVVARIRHLELLARIERELSGIDVSIVESKGRLLANLQCKFEPVAPWADVPWVDAPSVDVSSLGVSSVDVSSEHAGAVASRAVAPSAAAAAAQGKTPVPLRPLFTCYGKEAQLSPATVKRWTPVVERLIGHLGHDDALAITRADLVAWKDALLAAGMKNVTVRDVYLAATKALLQFAVDQGQLSENPAKEVKVRVKKKVKEREKGFDGVEAGTILAATRRPFSHLISAETAAARRWLPWIGAYTGARINELTPLTAADFVERDDTGDEVPNEDIVKGYELDKGQYIEVTKEELEELALESTRTIEIDEFVDKSDIDPRYLIRPYYVTPDGKIGHDAFAVIRETIREMDKVAIGRVVLTNREHIIALEPMDKGLVGTLLRYPYEVRNEQEYFDEIQNVKVTKDMLDLARHIVNQKAGTFDPGKFEDHYETALVDLINQKRAGKTIRPKERPKGENVVDLMEALRQSVGREAAPAKAAKPAKKPRKVSAGQKEMLMPIAGKKQMKEVAAKKPVSGQRRKSA